MPDKKIFKAGVKQYWWSQERKKNYSTGTLGLGINTFHDVLTTIVFMPHASGGNDHKFT